MVKPPHRDPQHHRRARTHYAQDREPHRRGSPEPRPTEHGEPAEAHVLHADAQADHPPGRPLRIGTSSPRWCPDLLTYASTHQPVPRTGAPELLGEPRVLLPTTWVYCPSLGVSGSTPSCRPVILTCRTLQPAHAPSHTGRPHAPPGHLRAPSALVRRRRGSP